MQSFIELLSHDAAAVWTWLLSLPETLVGVVIGSFFTLGGVVLTNRTNLKNLRLQLSHDREQRSKERALSMRRDVYLDAAEALSAGMSTIVRHGDLELTQASLMEDFRSKSGRIAKIHVIASETTAIRFVEFMRELTATFVKLSIQRNALLVTRGKMQSALDQMKRHQAGRDQYLEQMKMHNVDGSMDERRFNVLQSGFQFEQDSSARTAKEHESLLEELRPRHLEFADLCQQENARLARMLLPLVESIRNDLEQPINIREYEKVLSGAPAVPRADLEALFGVHKHDEET